MFQVPPGAGLVPAYVFGKPRGIIEVRGDGGLVSSRVHQRISLRVSMDSSSRHVEPSARSSVAERLLISRRVQGVLTTGEHSG